MLIDMRIVGDDGKELPWDGKAFGNLQARQWQWALPHSVAPGL